MRTLSGVHLPRPRRSWPTVTLSLLALSAPVLAPGAARAQTTRSDSTVADSWRLENGLEVRTLHVPRAPGVSVTLAFRAGSGYDPAGHEWLSEVLAELQFTGAAGDVPERTREEMASLRPLGWESRPGTRLVRFTEIATQAQLAGVLQQTARRLGGVQVTDAGLKAAIARIRRDIGGRLFGNPSDALYWRVGLIARGLDDEQILGLASLQGSDKLSTKDVEPLLRARYNAGNASLALVGDLSGIDARALVRAAFGSLPGGNAFPDTVQVRLRGGKREMTWKDLGAPAGVIAAEAPALADTLHPAFYLGMLITGPGLMDKWGAPKPPLVSRFQYSVLDEPELVRFYPPVPADASGPSVLASKLSDQLVVLGGTLVPSEVLSGVERSLRWVFGGELPAEVLRRVQSDPGGLGTISSGLATRALWRGDAFWKDYLRRFDTLKVGHSYYYAWLNDAKHQTTLLLTPAH